MCQCFSTELKKNLNLNRHQVHATDYPFSAHCINGAKKCSQCTLLLPYYFKCKITPGTRLCKSPMVQFGSKAHGTQDHHYPLFAQCPDSRLMQTNGSCCAAVSHILLNGISTMDMDILLALSVNLCPPTYRFSRTPGVDTWHTTNVVKVM